MSFLDRPVKRTPPSGSNIKITTYRLPKEKKNTGKARLKTLKPGDTLPLSLDPDSDYDIEEASQPSTFFPPRQARNLPGKSKATEARLAGDTLPSSFDDGSDYDTEEAPQRSTFFSKSRQPQTLQVKSQFTEMMPADEAPIDTKMCVAQNLAYIILLV